MYTEEKPPLEDYVEAVNELRHYGVAGMKRGVRKVVPQAIARAKQKRIEDREKPSGATAASARKALDARLTAKLKKNIEFTPDEQRVWEFLHPPKSSKRRSVKKPAPSKSQRR